MIYGMGMLELGMTFSFCQLVIDNEIVNMTKRVLSGVTVEEELMGVDLIKKVGIGGNFLSQRHVLKHLATEQAQTTIFDRRMRGAWEKRGSKDLACVATERAKEILTTHKPLPLPDGVAAELRKIVKSAE